jgi:site-specific recombinase XerD
MPLERRSYWDLMQRYGRLADIPKAERQFHALRHAIAVHLLDAGADVAFVQGRLGHANIQNTMVYMRYTTVTRDAQTRHLFASHRVV